jgi:uncharacterized protein (DUF4415 family)
MSEKHIVRHSADELRAKREKGESRTDWARVDALTDADIERAIDEDPDAAPILDEEWFRQAEVRMPEAKRPVSLRVDRDVLDFFKAEGRGYQTRMNAVLRAYVDHHRQKRSGGGSAPHSGQYESVGPRGGKTGVERTVARGEPLPPAKAAGRSYKLIDPKAHREPERNGARHAGERGKAK